MSRFRTALRGVLLVVLVFAVSSCDGLRWLFPSSETDTEPPELPAELASPALLVFSKTNGFRHEEAIPAGIERFQAIADQRGWGIYFTENGAIHNALQLARFDAIVWHNVSGTVLDEAQQAALVSYLEQGGGFVGLHGSGGDSSYDWKWYVDELIGAQFIGHTLGPQFQDARVVVEDRSHPATASLPADFTHNEEWYSFDRNVRDRDEFTVLLSVDESSYSPEEHLLWMDEDLRMGDHPVVWTRCIGRGRVFYSALGHQAGAYASAEGTALLGGAVAWAARQQGVGCD